MDQLIQKLKSVHGLSEQESLKILGTIADFLKEKFPMVGGAIDNLFQSEATSSGNGTTPAEVQSAAADPIKNNQDLKDKISEFIPGANDENIEDFAKKNLK
jgi:hypothetical protein